tara:strand:+ start:2144 stop:2440 length:297 start_codon:yes stop_codon:yes gene_type:complete
MLSKGKQNEINSNFVKIFKNVIEKNKMNPHILLTQLCQFEETDIDDKTTKTILKIMLDVPYYENNINVSVLRKFKIMKEKLHDIIDTNLSIRLLNLRK